MTDTVSHKHPMHIGSRHIGQVDFPRIVPVFGSQDINSSKQQILSKIFAKSSTTRLPTNIENGPTQAIATADAMPHRVRQRRAEVLEWKKSRILDTSNKTWDKTTSIVYPANQSNQMMNHVYDRSRRYQYNYRAETLQSLRNPPPPDQSTKFHISTQTLAQSATLRDLQNSSLLNKGNLKRVEEMPIHPNLEFSKPWNSTTTVEVKELGKLLDNRTREAILWTKKKNNLLGGKLLSDGTVTISNNAVVPYVGPMTGQKILSETIRDMKREKSFDTSTQLGMLARSAIDNTIDGKNATKREELRRAIDEDPKRSGMWGFNTTTKTYQWADDISQRTARSADNRYIHNENSYATNDTDAYTISTADNTFLKQSSTKKSR